MTMAGSAVWPTGTVVWFRNGDQGVVTGVPCDYEACMIPECTEVAMPKDRAGMHQRFPAADLRTEQP